MEIYIKFSICSDSTKTILISPEENFLIDKIMPKDDVPNDVVSRIAVYMNTSYRKHLFAIGDIFAKEVLNLTVICISLWKH